MGKISLVQWELGIMDRGYARMSTTCITLFSSGGNGALLSDLY